MMSDNLPPSSYASCFADKTKTYEHQLRLLVMRLFMDHLSLENIESFLFVYKLPQRLKDNGRPGLRSEVLNYINEQLLDKWRKTPSALQIVLKELGRDDLSIKVEELVENYSTSTVCQETIPFVSQQEAAASNLSHSGELPVKRRIPVQETEQFAQMQHAEDEVNRDCTVKDMSSTEGEIRREPQPVARNTLPPSRHTTGKGTRQRELENIPEESLSQEEDRPDSGSLKRTSSTASEASFRSSGYYSNPRASDLRLSQLSLQFESVPETENEEQDSTSLSSIKQARNTEEDEGVVMNIDHTNEFLDSHEGTEAESSSTAPSPSRSSSKSVEEAAAEADMEDQGDSLLPVSRLRCFQVSRTPSHKKKQPWNNNDLLAEDSEMRRRSRSLPSTSRIDYLRNAPLSTLSSSPRSPLSNSSSTSLDSETTIESQSEQSSMTGSQLSIASATSGHDSKPNSLSRRMSPPTQKPLPVVSEVMLSGSMKIKVKNILKSIEKNDQVPFTSSEFPCVKGHPHGPRYQIRFFPSNFSKEKSSALYIDVAKSYLHKKAKRKLEHHRMVEIPPMDITVHLTYGSEGASCEGQEIKMEKVETDMKTIDSISRGESSKRLVVASFPQLVSHADLNLPEALAEGRSLLVIRVEMSVRS